MTTFIVAIHYVGLGISERSSFSRFGRIRLVPLGPPVSEAVSRSVEHVGQGGKIQALREIVVTHIR